MSDAQLNVPQLHFAMKRLRQFRPFVDARLYAHGLCLEKSADWVSWCSSGARPVDIPACPQTYYKDLGWSGFGDWLGIGKPAEVKRFATFEEAREWASARFRTVKEFRACKRPPHIPSCPEATYKNSGWQGFVHFLRSTNRSTRQREYMTFSKAHSYAISLNLKTRRAWWQWSAAGHMPFNLPSCPHVIYKDCGWQSYAHWLGTNRKG